MYLSAAPSSVLVMSTLPQYLHSCPLHTCSSSKQCTADHFPPCKCIYIITFPRIKRPGSRTGHENLTLLCVCVPRCLATPADMGLTDHSGTHVLILLTASLPVPYAAMPPKVSFMLLECPSCMVPRDPGGRPSNTVVPILWGRIPKGLVITIDSFFVPVR